MIDSTNRASNIVDNQSPIQNDLPPNIEAPKAKTFEDIASKLAQTHADKNIRPPELRFKDIESIGGPRFEQQAIQNIDVLKLEYAETTVNNLAAFLIANGSDIHTKGSEWARAGAATLDNFLNLNAAFAAMKAGRD